jgi:hypothetical protein
MYPHTELGCGCEFRFDDYRCGWPISQCAVRSAVIVVPPPGVGQHLRLRHTEKDLTVKQFISELTVKAFDVAVLPGTARFDKQGLHTQFCQPWSHRPGHKTRAHCLTGCASGHHTSTSTWPAFVAPPGRSACDLRRWPDTAGCIHPPPSGISTTDHHPSGRRQSHRPAHGCDTRVVSGYRSRR